MRIPTEVGELYVEDEGHGPPVVFWHSYLHHGGMWQAQLAALRGRHRTISIDAPGHGRSEALRRPIDMDACARAVGSVLDARGVGRATFVGLSWGGMVAMTLAVRAPARLSAMALFDTSCRREPLRKRVEYMALGTIERAIGVPPFLLDRVEPLFFCDETRRTRRDRVDAWRSYVVRMDAMSIWYGLRCIVERRDLERELRAVRIPTVVVVGAEDRAQPPRESEAIAAAIPGARLAVIPRAGHLSALERPDEANAILDDFLGRHAPAGALGVGSRV